ncbi:MAG: toprim domain-containing protein [Clostridia bacterium]|nr:toprim domain-containing protein [Clostridia bacterium]
MRLKDYSEDCTEISREILTRLGINVPANKRQFSIKCLNPEHADHSPSMSVSLEKGICHCFACNYTGKLTNIYYEKFGTSIYKDLNIGARRSYVPTINTIVDFSKTPDTDFVFEGNLTSIRNNPNGIKWASSRGFSPDFCDKNNIRYGDFFITKQKSNPLDKKEWNYFNKCVVIPIFENSKLISFEARDTQGKEAWINWHKNNNVEYDEKEYKKVLYPRHSSINTIYEFNKLDTTKPLFITEGLMDMFSLRTNSTFKNSSCLFHCMPTERQIYLLNKFPKIIYVIDNDLPGMKACLYLMEKLKGKVAYLRPPIRPNVKDINDILQGKDGYISSVDDLLNMGWMDKISDNIDSLKEIISLNSITSSRHKPEVAKRHKIEK